MTTHDRTDTDTDTSLNDHDPRQDSAMTPEQATALLAQAERARGTVPASIPSAVVTLGMLCAIGTLGSLAWRFAAQMPQINGFDAGLVVGVLIFCWILLATFLPMLFRAPWRRGLGVRWAIYCVIWSVLWGASASLPGMAGLMASVLFIPLFAVACGIEAKHARTREEA